MNIKQLASYIAKAEGKTHQSSVGDIREVLALLSDVINRENVEKGYSSSMLALLKNGQERSKKRK